MRSFRGAPRPTTHCDRNEEIATCGDRNRAEARQSLHRHGAHISRGTRPGRLVASAAGSGVSEDAVPPSRALASGTHDGHGRRRPGTRHPQASPSPPPRRSRARRACGTRWSGARSSRRWHWSLEGISPPSGNKPVSSASSRCNAAVRLSPTRTPLLGEATHRPWVSRDGGAGCGPPPQDGCDPDSRFHQLSGSSTSRIREPRAPRGELVHLDQPDRGHRHDDELCDSHARSTVNGSRAVSGARRGSHRDSRSRSDTGELTMPMPWRAASPERAGRTRRSRRGSRRRALSGSPRDLQVGALRSHRRRDRAPHRRRRLAPECVRQRVDAARRRRSPRRSLELASVVCDEIAREPGRLARAGALALERPRVCHDARRSARPGRRAPPARVRLRTGRAGVRLRSGRRRARRSAPEVVEAPPVRAETRSARDMHGRCAGGREDRARRPC